MSNNNHMLTKYWDVVIELSRFGTTYEGPTDK